MSLTQTHFRGRRDHEPLNSVSFDYDTDTAWTQQTGKPFRVRFEVSGANTIGGTLEAQVNGGGYNAVTTTSGTVTAAYSEQFTDEDQTSQVIGRGTAAFTAGEGSQDGLTAPIALTGGVTELEYAVKVSSGGTVDLRIAGLDTYAEYPTVLVTDLSTLALVRLRCGDNDATDQILTDSEVNAFIAAWPNNSALAAASAAEAIAAKFARDFSFSTDGQSFQRKERVLHYMGLAESLRRAAYLVWPT